VTPLLIILCFPLLSLLPVLAGGEAYARRIALVFSTAAAVLTAYLALQFGLNPETPMVIDLPWINRPAVRFHLTLDGLSMLMLLLTNFLMPLIILAAGSGKPERPSAFFALIALMHFALNGVFLATDGLLYYIFWELALIPIYFIALLWSDNADKQKVGKVVFKFFVYTLAGSLLMLISFIWLYFRSGDFLWVNLAQLSLEPTEQLLIFIGFFLAFAIKIPIFPFHTWQADTYREAPAAGTMLLSGLMLKMGIYSLLRWLIPILPEAVELAIPIVLILCVGGLIYGSILAFAQDDFKRLLAFSSLAHVGLISAGVFTFSVHGFQGAAFQMVSHGLYVVGLFFVAELIRRRTGTLFISELGGIRQQAPVLTTLFSIVLLGSVGLPLTSGFIGEFLLLFSVYEYNTILGIVAGFSVILGAAYMLRAFQRIMLGTQTSATQNFKDLSIMEAIPLLAICIGIIALGLYPAPVLQLAQPALDHLLELALR